MLFGRLIVEKCWEYHDNMVGYDMKYYWDTTMNNMVGDQGE